jgi:16S rRNA (cytidine1402-2'-O)-methyltransferase
MIGTSAFHSAKIKGVGTLYLVATPIGNLEDITLRAIRMLREVDLIAAEDTRHTKKLLNHYKIATPLLSYHEHNKEEGKNRILEALAQGDVALVSDAGTPVLSDPGYELIQEVLKVGHNISPIPGPSAPITALIASGLPTDSFLFLGYLPRRPNERKTVFQSISNVSQTLVCFEVPHRLIETLIDLEDVLGGDRRIAVCRELTKVHEEILRGSVKDVRERFSQVSPRGEFTLVIAGASKDVRWQIEDVRNAVIAYLEEGMSPSEVARRVAAESRWLRQEVYRITLEVK